MLTSEHLGRTITVKKKDAWSITGVLREIKWWHDTIEERSIAAESFTEMLGRKWVRLNISGWETTLAVDDPDVTVVLP